MYLLLPLFFFSPSFTPVDQHSRPGPSRSVRTARGRRFWGVGEQRLRLGRSTSWPGAHAALYCACGSQVIDEDIRYFYFIVGGVGGVGRRRRRSHHHHFFVFPFRVYDRAIPQSPCFPCPHPRVCSLALLPLSPKGNQIERQGAPARTTSSLD